MKKIISRIKKILIFGRDSNAIENVIFSIIMFWAMFKPESYVFTMIILILVKVVKTEILVYSLKEMVQKLKSAEELKDE